MKKKVLFFSVILVIIISHRVSSFSIKGKKKPLSFVSFQVVTLLGTNLS